MRQVAIILLTVLTASAETIVLTPVQDAYICDCQPDVTNPNGGPTHLYHGRYGSCHDRTLIRWDLSGIPEGAVVESASMQLYCISFTGTPSGEPVYYLIDEDWDELTVTFNNQPAYGDSPSVGATWPQPQSWFPVDVTQLVQEWVAGTHQNYGIYCTSLGCTGTSVPGFWSKDSSHPDLLPRLEITYTVTALDGSTWAAIKTCPE